MTKVSTEQINALLPQTQCEECGYKGCKPYAEAISREEADINLCAPGGISVLEKLGKICNKDIKLHRDYVNQHFRPESIAIIDETVCIGCVKCINGCPVDGIVGTAKMMHTVIEDICTGCNLCVPACPVDCIEIKPAKLKNTVGQRRTRYEKRLLRLDTITKSKQIKHQDAKLSSQKSTSAEKKSAITDAIARAKAKKNK